MVITILGSSGFIGSNLCKSLKKSYKIKKLNLRKLNVSLKEQQLINLFNNKFKKSKYIINCCASLKPKSNQDFFINSKLPIIIQKTLSKMKNKPHFIHISTLNVYLDQRTDDYTLSKKLGEIKLKNKCTSIIRLPIIINDIDKRQSTGNLNKLNNYLDQKFLPVYPMLYPGHLYQPIEIKNLNLFFKSFLKKKKKLFTYNLVGKNKLSLWDMYEMIAKKKNKKIVRINTKYLNFMKKFLGKNKIIRNNDFLSQLFYIDQSKLRKIRLIRI